MSRLYCLQLQQEAEDGGVAAERERVLSGRAQQDAVCLAMLHKRYGAPGTKVTAPAVTWPHILANTERYHGGAVIA